MKHEISHFLTNQLHAKGPSEAASSRLDSQYSTSYGTQG
jgi:hypothetical protein